MPPPTVAHRDRKKEADRKACRSRIETFREGDSWIARYSSDVIDHTAQASTPSAAIRECVAGVRADLEYALEYDTMEHLKPDEDMAKLPAFPHTVDGKPLSAEQYKKLCKMVIAHFKGRGNVVGVTPT